MEPFIKPSIYNFLLVCHCNYSSSTYRFRVIWRYKTSWPWNPSQG